MKKVRARIIGILILLIEKFTSYRFLSKNYNLCLSNSPLVIDIGSNRGQFIDMILDIRKKATILSFEANPKFENHLRDKYANKPNIKTFNCAVSSVNEQKEFFLNAFDETSSFEELNLDSKYLRKKSAILGVKPENIIIDKITVNCKTLDSIIDTFVNSQSIDLVKIDVEGHEIEVLRGLTPKYASYIKRIQTEFHFDDMYLKTTALQEIISLMNSLGFQEEFRYKHKFGEFIEIIFLNSTNASDF